MAISSGGASGLTLVDLVQSWAVGSPNSGLELRAHDEADATGWKRFNSADAGSNAPTLVVSYSGDISQNPDGSDAWTDATSAAEFSTACVPDKGADYDTAYTTFGTDNQPICAAIYVPTGSSPASAVIIVHGGGWRKGGRYGVNAEANYIRNKGYLAVSIDYRLSCPVAVGNSALCGFNAITPVSDVGTAVAWVKANASTYLPNGFSNKVFVLGFSAGGNLALMVGAGAGGLSADQTPAAVAAWSGPTELGIRAGDSKPGCHQSHLVDSCNSADDQYVGLMNDCTVDYCDPLFDNASPYPLVFTTGQSQPVFLANNSAELIPLQQAIDYDGLLTTKQISHTYCPVTGAIATAHATAYEKTGHCNGGTPDVFDATLAFFASYA